MHEVGAERLPLADRSADTVLATLTLCTVQDLPLALSEIRRVLRPDGRVVVLEHVLSQDPGLASWQRRLSGPWGWLGGGCSPVRTTGDALADGGGGIGRLEALAGFAAGLGECFIEGGVVGPELLLRRGSEGFLVVMDEHHVAHGTVLSLGGAFGSDALMTGGGRRISTGPRAVSRKKRQVPVGQTGRTSTVPNWAAGRRLAQSSAASRSGTSIR